MDPSVDGNGLSRLSAIQGHCWLNGGGGGNERSECSSLFLCHSLKVIFGDTLHGQNDVYSPPPAPLERLPQPPDHLR